MRMGQEETALAVVLHLLLLVRDGRQVDQVRSCGLEVVVDPLLWVHVRQGVVDGGGEGPGLDAGDEVRRLAWLRTVSLVHRLVNTANNVVGRYEFGGDQLVVTLKNIKVRQLYSYRMSCVLTTRFTLAML